VYERSWRRRSLRSPPLLSPDEWENRRMRSIWKGALSFGLVSIPVKLYSATQSNDVAFHQVHEKDGGRIRYKRVCEVDGEEVRYEDIAKGYELPTGETVVLTDDDFDALPLPTTRAVDVVQFVPAEQVDPIYFNKSYYLEPDAHGLKPYVLLRDALDNSDRVAVVKVALRNRESLATIRVREGVLVLETMLWPDEIREADFSFLDEDVEVRSQELQMAESLIETMTDDFDPAQFSDQYREALEEVISAKVEGRDVVAPKEPKAKGEVVDLMAALKASVESARKGERPSAAVAAAPSKRKTAAKKSSGTTKRAASSTTKRSASKKSASKSASKSTTRGRAKKFA
jgi:DNA end-binding protein Ku